MSNRFRAVRLGVIAVSVCGSAASAQTLTTIPGLAGGISSWVGGISDDGLAVCGDAVLLSGSARAWRWLTSGAIQNLGVLPGSTDSYGYGISGNGLVVIGASGSTFDVAHRWTSGSGMQGLGLLTVGQPSFASSATFDGSTIIGYGYFGNGLESAWRWTSATGMQPFGQLLAGTDQSVGLATNGDGSVVAGYCYHNAPALVYPTACRWNASGAATSLGVLAGKIQSVPGAVSRNGAVVVGYCSDGQGQAMVPFQWTVGGGMVQLPLPAGAVQGVAGSVNSDGSLIVGYTLDAVSNVRCCVWNAGVPVAMDTYLQSRGVTTTGWTLEVGLVAAEGTAFAGMGRINGASRGWHVSFGTGCTGAPTISVDPLTQTVAAGSSVTLSISAAGATGYQWYHNSQAIAGAIGPGTPLCRRRRPMRGNTGAPRRTCAAHPSPRPRR